jgi:hypothetical protein
MILNEGGSMPGVGPIHIDEIEPTISALEKALGINLKDNVLGSVGKKEFSGDIDIAIDIDPKKKDEFLQRLKKSPVVVDIKDGSAIMTSVDIVNYDPEKQTSKPRTGKVQVDFMPGNPSWMKSFYHAPHEKDSKYKGVFRNLMIAAITFVYEVETSEETTEDGRPLEVERWMWSVNNGLIRVIRKPKPKANGKGYTQQNINEPIGKPIKDMDKVAQTLGLGSAEDLYSFETMLAAIEKNYPSDMVAKVKEQFVNNSTVQDIGVPDELRQKTESLADKNFNRIQELIGRMR